MGNVFQLSFLILVIFLLQYIRYYLFIEEIFGNSRDLRDFF